MVRRSGDEEWILQIRPDELSRAGPFLRPVAVPEFVWPEPMGDTVASRACEHWLCLVRIEVRAIRGPERKPNRSTGHVDLAWVRLLRALRHSRSVAATLLDHVHSGTAWFVETRHAELPVVCRDGISGHDPHKGNLRHPCRLRCACHSSPNHFQRVKSRSRC